MLEPEKLVIAANRIGQLKLAMSNDSIKIETCWDGLKHADNEEMDDKEAESSKRFKSIRVDLKALSKLLSCQLPEHNTELWIYARACATFVVSTPYLETVSFAKAAFALPKFHVKSAVGDKKFMAHFMVSISSIVVSSSFTYL